MPAIRKVAVIGSGGMGSGIAAQAANAGLEVILLDIVANESADRNSVAAGAVQRMRKTNPAPLMHPRNAARIGPAISRIIWIGLQTAILSLKWSWKTLRSKGTSIGRSMLIAGPTAS